jgi:hypothetical protein
MNHEDCGAAGAGVGVVGRPAGRRLARDRNQIRGSAFK